MPLRTGAALHTPNSAFTYCPHANRYVPSTRRTQLCRYIPSMSVGSTRCNASFDFTPNLAITYRCCTPHSTHPTLHLHTVHTPTVTYRPHTPTQLCCYVLVLHSTRHTPNSAVTYRCSTPHSTFNSAVTYMPHTQLCHYVPVLHSTLHPTLPLLSTRHTPNFAVTYRPHTTHPMPLHTVHTPDSQLCCCVSVPHPTLHTPNSAVTYCPHATHPIPLPVQHSTLHTQLCCYVPSTCHTPNRSVPSTRHTPNSAVTYHPHANPTLLLRTGAPLHTPNAVTYRCSTTQLCHYLLEQHITTACHTSNYPLRTGAGIHMTLPTLPVPHPSPSHDSHTCLPLHPNAHACARIDRTPSLSSTLDA